MKKRNTENIDWRDSIMIPKDDSKYRNDFIKMLEPFQNMRGWHLRNSEYVTCWIEMKKPYIRRIRSAPLYHTKPDARDPEKKEIKKMLEAGVIKPARTEWASPIVFVCKEYGKLLFCADCRKLRCVTIEGLGPPRRMNRCTDSLSDG